MSTENDTAELRKELIALAPSVESSSLYLLHAIADTVDSLQKHEQLAGSISAVVRSLANRISRCEVVQECYIDPEDECINKIEASYRMVENELQNLLPKKAAINKDMRLDLEQQDLLHTAYDRCIAAFDELVEAAKTLRAATITHDLAAEPPPSETFDSPAALIHSLHAYS
jgi:hypothetical protein